jgi:L-rhamnose-H+ transport protein
MPIAQVTSAYLGDAGTVFKNNSPIWSLALLGGFIPNFFYCGYLLVRTGSWQKYGQPGTYLYWLWGIFMGGIFISGAMFYGAGASNLGKLGTTVGWLVFIATGILIANLWGVITGEWKFAPSIARLRMVQGSLLLALSIILVGLGNYLLE